MSDTIPDWTMESDNFIVRRTQPSDWQALNRIYFQVSGIQRSKENFFWEWFDAPFGRNDSYVIIQKTTNTIIGHHGVIKVPIIYNNRKLIAGRTENSMLLPEYRTSVPYFQIERQILPPFDGPHKPCPCCWIVFFFT